MQSLRRRKRGVLCCMSNTCDAHAVPYAVSRVLLASLRGPAPAGGSRAEQGSLFSLGQDHLARSENSPRPWMGSQTRYALQVF